MTFPRKLVAVASLAVTLAHASFAQATPHFGAWDDTSVFYISKSENKNEVHYGVRLDAQCKVVGDQPVYVYWQMKADGLPRVEDLLPREESAYGIASQSVAGNTIRVSLRAIADRTITIQIAKSENSCRATPQMTIARASARLDHVFVQLAWPFGVSYLLVIGNSETGAAVQEKIVK
jgi:Domain of unknown function (DUF4833)